MKRISLNQLFIKVPIANRGLHDLTISENSLRAFLLAKERKLNIKIDVRMTLDNEMVVSHDNNLLRMCGIDKKISKMTLEEVKKIRLFDNQEIPTLQEVLDLINGEVGIDIELKHAKKMVKIYGEKILTILDSYLFKERIIIKSYNPKLVRYLKKHTDLYPIGQMSQGLLRKSNFIFRYLMSSLLVIKYSHADFISYCISNLPNKYCSKYRKRGYPLIAWTVRNERTLNKAIMFADNYLFETIDIDNLLQQEIAKVAIEQRLLLDEKEDFNKHN